MDRSNSQEHELDQVWKTLDKIGDSLKDINDKITEIKVDVAGSKVMLKEIGGNGKPGKIQEIMIKLDEHEDRIEAQENRWSKAYGWIAGAGAICGVIWGVVELGIKHYADILHFLGQ